MSARAMSPMLVAEVAERFKALGEPARLQLLLALREGERTVTDLVSGTGLGQANVSKHLQQLTAAGFVRRRKEGTFAFYALADKEAFALCDLMCGRIAADQQRKRAGLRLAR